MQCWALLPRIKWCPSNRHTPVVRFTETGLLELFFPDKIVAYFLFIDFPWSQQRIPFIYVKSSHFTLHFLHMCTICMCDLILTAWTQRKVHLALLEISALSTDLENLVIGTCVMFIYMLSHVNGSKNLRKQKVDDVVAFWSCYTL